ncbi:MAG TPA: hypothetical protein DIC60_09650 [Lachnospiraceae bacterium]|nr:hypothetical protein [Lachnospiraceae bacterium]
MKIKNRKKRYILILTVICLVASNYIQASLNDLGLYHYTSTQTDETETLYNEQTEETNQGAAEVKINRRTRKNRSAKRNSNREYKNW